MICVILASSKIWLMRDAILWMSNWLNYLGDAIEEGNGAGIARDERG